jgi:hypothetical protein
MRKFLTKSVFVTAVFIVTSAFISCDSSVSKKENEILIVADNSIPVSKKIKKSTIKNQLFLLQVLTKERKPFIPMLALILKKRDYK